MKLFWRIAGGVLVGLVVIIIALNLYFTDARLKALVVPQINETLGREITVDHIGITFFRTFPSFGLSVKGLMIPDTDYIPELSPGERVRPEHVQAELASLNEMILSVEIFPLFSGNLNVNKLNVDGFNFNYIIFEDGSTNLDSLLEFMADDTSEPDAEQSSASINLNSVTLSNSRISFDDRSTGTHFSVNGLGAFMSLRYAEKLETTVNAQAESIRFRSDGTTWINNLPVQLTQTSIVDTDNEEFQISDGRLRIRGLELNMEGMISEWSAESLLVDLRLESSSDDLSSLLALVPETYADQIAGVSTRGTATVKATINGRVGGDEFPDFNALISVEDGFLKYPGVESPIDNIQIRMEAGNELITISQLSAEAEVNTISVTGNIFNPLEDDASFDLNTLLNLNLATVERFYPLNGMQLSGLLNLDGNAQGVVSKADEAQFNFNLRLSDGFFKLPDLDEPVTDVQVQLNATQALIQIASLNAKAAGNTLALSGSIRQPLDETRSTFDVHSTLDLDLATIPKFYPIDSDTLDMRGKIRFNGTANGRVSTPEDAVINGTLVIENGFVKYHLLPQTLDEIKLDSRIAGERFVINQGSLKTGGNSFSASGDINRFMSDNPLINLNIRGIFELAEIDKFFDLRPMVNQISGRAETNLRVNGPATKPESLIFNGTVKVNDFFVDSDSLVKPIENLNGELLFSNENLNLTNLTFKMGESDYTLSGTLAHYMRLVDENSTQLAELNATFFSNKLNIDEIYQWEPTPEDQQEPFPIELPRIKSNLTIDIREMIFFGVPITNLTGNVKTTDKQIAINNASANFFGGAAKGQMVWDVPQPDRTKITFKGELDNMRVEDVLKRFNPAGMADAHQYFSGGFSTAIEYITELDVFLDPILETTRTNGNFGMTRARMQNHPAQLKAAELLRTVELKNLSLDNLLSKVTITDNIMTLRDFNLTSRDIGVVLNGTQDIIQGNINYSVSIVLPGNLANNLIPVLTADGIEALKREDGKVEIPFRITGTTDDPSAGLDTERIQARITEYLRLRGTDAIRNRLRGLFN